MTTNWLLFSGILLAGMIGMSQMMAAMWSLVAILGWGTWGNLTVSGFGLSGMVAMGFVGKLLATRPVGIEAGVKHDE